MADDTEAAPVAAPEAVPATPAPAEPAPAPEPAPVVAAEPQAAPIETAPAATDPQADLAAAIVVRFVDSLRNSPASRDAEVWNYLTVAVAPALQADILKGLQNGSI